MSQLRSPVWWPSSIQLKVWRFKVWTWSGLSWLRSPVWWPSLSSTSWQGQEGHQREEKAKGHGQRDSDLTGQGYECDTWLMAWQLTLILIQCIIFLCNCQKKHSNNISFYGWESDKVIAVTGWGLRKWRISYSGLFITQWLLKSQCLQTYWSPVVVKHS